MVTNDGEEGAVSCRIATATLVFFALLGCEVKNRDHCLHKSDAPDQWCADNESNRGFCSPCASADARHGCVAAPPNDCAEYEPDAIASTSSSDSSSSGASGEATTG